ncbi:MAG: asparaginase, partial [Cyclobacteriaceae bacterium]|jgi:L-asparaginase
MPVHYSKINLLKMSPSVIRINTALPGTPRARVMIVYTGGTFGMVRDSSGVLIPLDFGSILEHLPALRQLQLELSVVAFDEPIDSSNIEPHHWREMADIVQQHYRDQDGFVILHGTDTMAYTASALSFMLEGLAKPVIFTGAQLPISEPRSDARENLITALEIAAAKGREGARVPEVCIYFGSELLRGNRAKKAESQHFDAFQSENYPPLAKAGVKIDYLDSAIHRPGPGALLHVRSTFDSRVGVLRIFPGINPLWVRSVTETPDLKGLILETYGSGNATTARWFLDAVRNLVSRGVIVLNVSQCPGGMVIQGKYETSRELAAMGVIGGGDMTLEAAVTKMMLLLGEYGPGETRTRIGVSMAGELTHVTVT